MTSANGAEATRKPISNGSTIMKNEDSRFWDRSWAKEGLLLMNLTVPTVIIQLGFTIPPFWTASYVGRTFGTIFLDGFQLANLTMNLFTLTLLQGLYSASDTLGPQAYGANNFREVGLIAMRGYLGSMLVVIPICLVLLIFMKQLLIAFGEDSEAAIQAARWYRVYVCSMPFYTLYMVTWKFLSAQHVMLPLALVCIFCCAVVLPLSLHAMTSLFGFVGSAMAVFTFQFSQAMLLLMYLRIFRPYRPECWPGLQAWRESLNWKAFRVYFHLGAGGMIASSEWIFWEILSLAIGTMGTAPLATHTVPTQVLTVSFMIPLGIGIALAVRLGATIAKDVRRAKQLTVATCAISTTFFAFMSILMYTQRSRIIPLFTIDPDVMNGCERIWWKVCFYFFHLSVYGLNMGIATGLGEQWLLGFVTVVCLWGLGLPTAWYIGVARHRSLEVVWDWLYPPYIIMNAWLVFVFVTKDWSVISAEVRRRENMRDEIIETATLGTLAARTHSQYGSVNEEGRHLLVL